MHAYLNKVTPSELRQWRLSFNWSTRQAAEELGIAERAYKYLEQGVTSAGNSREQIPRYIELATAAIARNQKWKPK